MYKKIVIGVDQSYKQTGISIAADGKLLMVKSTNFKGLKTKSEKRNHLRNIINRLIIKASKKASEIVIFCERIRTFNAAQSYGKKKSPFGGINPTYIKVTGALIGAIVDIASVHGVNVYSVDTRSWKAQIVGSSKAKGSGKNRDSKSETVEFVQRLGFDLFVREKKVGKNKGEKIYDDDAADSACIALYGFILKSKQKVVQEE